MGGSRSFTAARNCGGERCPPDRSEPGPSCGPWDRCASTNRRWTIRGGAMPRHELTQIKCYRGGELDWASDDTLTQVRGYPSPEHESVRQTRISRQDSRPL